MASIFLFKLIILISFGVHIIMWGEQKKRLLSFVITILQIMSWVSATSRPFPQAALVQSANSLQVQWQSKQGFYGKEMEGTVREEAVKGSGSVGSRPPNCARKCGGCTPCEAMQVPTTTDHLDPQYANYEPEGWKCKCGTSFFNP